MGSALHCTFTSQAVTGAGHRTLGATMIYMVYLVTNTLVWHVATFYFLELQLFFSDSFITLLLPYVEKRASDEEKAMNFVNEYSF